MRWIFLLLPSLFLGALGCGQEQPPFPLVSATGKVTLKDGTPVTAGAIYFCPEGTSSYTPESSSSLLQKDGSFTVKTFPWGNGIPAGKYKVVLADELAGRLSKPKYGRVEETPWQIDVPQEGVKDHTFVVE